MNHEIPEPVQAIENLNQIAYQEQVTISTSEATKWWYSKVARILATAALITSGMIAIDTARPRAAMAADSDTYSWSGATALDEATDDYGYATCPNNDSGCKNYPSLLYTLNGTTYGEADPWGYALRNCTSYIAEKISQEFNGLNISGWGNASDWATSAANAGYSVYAHGDGYTPQIGDIAVWGSEVGGGYGHVAYVASVSGSGNSAIATFDEYNVAETGEYTNYYTSADHPGGQVYPDDYIHIGILSGSGGGGGVAPDKPTVMYNPSSGLPAIAARGPGNELEYYFQRTDGSFGEVNIGNASAWPSIAFNPGTGLPVIADENSSNTVQYYFQNSDGSFSEVNP